MVIASEQKILKNMVSPIEQKNSSTLNEATTSASSKVRKIAVLTSGGDAPGMNCAVRAIVRAALIKKCIPYGIMEGYQGLVEGGDKIKVMKWLDVQGILSQGGTVIGTARCKEFRTREGRLRAALNLVRLGVDALIVIGGDGSLTGADMLRGEWSGLVDELLKTEQITAEMAAESRYLSIVGLVGSIDNDMSGTDMTIGAVSSLHRICEAVDSISSTASSHQRAFVIEVMGRNCGWLALMAAISTGADWLFIPERPPIDDWQAQMCKQLHRDREMGKRKSIIIVAEGAIDRDLQPIKADYVKQLVCEQTGIDTRVTTLGHVQRGGSPAFLDRIIATVQGIEAVEAILKSTPETEAPVIGISENKITVKPLMESVKLTREVGEAIQQKNFDRAMELRDPEFHCALDSLMQIITRGSEADQASKHHRLRIAILHTGAPAGGMNTATRTAVRMALNRGHTPLLVQNGFSGLIAGDIRPVSWMDVESWTIEGGSNLGTNRSQPADDIGLCAYQLQQHGIQSMILIGGFEAYTALLQLEKARETYIPFCIPTIVIPATISNNVPGTDFSLGADTALNVIIEACDRIRQSAYSSRKRVFVVEVQGGNCGFLASLAGLAAGATCAYVPEEGITLDMISKDCRHLIQQFQEGENQGRVIIRNECASDTYTTEVLSNIFKEEGKGIYDSRTAILGHIQQGGSTSPFDRVRATRFAVRAVKWIEAIAFPAIDKHQALRRQHGMLDKMMSPTITERIDRADMGPDAVDSKPPASFDHDAVRLDVSHGVYTKSEDSAAVIGIVGTSIVETPVKKLHDETDFKNRTVKKLWWKRLTALIRVLAKYGYEDIPARDY